MEVAMILSSVGLIISQQYSRMQGTVIVDMKDKYPFGQLKEANQDNGAPLVKKQLNYSGPEQLDLIKQMVGLLQKLKHPQIIKLESYELLNEKTFNFYYQYIPLTLEKWILDLGEDILDELQEQMIALTRYLTKHNIKFHFDPDCLGLSKDIKVKYFLQEFMVDSENQNEYYEEVTAEIEEYFQDFKTTYGREEEASTDFTERKSADSALLGRLGMLNDRGSWETGTRLAHQRSKKQNLLSQKVQNSKKKSMQILMRLKAMKPRSQQ